MSFGTFCRYEEETSDRGKYEDLRSFFEEAEVGEEQ
jgi:hypothetical protein